jgi:hypothetical protein
MWRGAPVPVWIPVKQARCGLALGTAFFLLAGRQVVAQEFTFVTIVDTETAVPGSSERFTWFGAPCIDDTGDVVFFGGSALGHGLYTTCGGSLRVVADPAVPIPGGEGTFEHGFRSYGAWIEAGTIAFYAFTRSTELGGGVYLWRNGSVSLVADMNTPIPGGTGTFTAIEDPFGFGPFSHPPTDGRVVAFCAAADWPRQRGIYTFADGKLALVANLETPLPAGDGLFTFLSSEIGIENGSVVFRGEGQEFQRGIYTNVTGPLTKVADRTDTVPAGHGTFTSLRYPLFDNGTVVFAGEGADGQQGIYRWDGASVTAVVDVNTLVPGEEEPFTAFVFNWSPPSASHGNVASWARGPGDREGIYLAEPGSLRTVIDTTGTIHGKAVKALTMGPQGLAGNTLAFQVRFTDDTYAVCLATSVAFRRGDANTDGAVDIADAIFSLMYLFGSGSSPTCLDAADANDDGTVDTADSVMILMHLFAGAGDVPEPCGRCGGDPTPDDLGCMTYVHCSR